MRVRYLVAAAAAAALYLGLVLLELGVWWAIVSITSWVVTAAAAQWLERLAARPRFEVGMWIRVDDGTEDGTDHWVVGYTVHDGPRYRRDPWVFRRRRNAEIHVMRLADHGQLAYEIREVPRR